MNPSVQLPQYRCHKVVSAAKILNITPTEDGKLSVLHFEFPERPGTPSAYKEVDPLWMQKNRPEIGGYFVVYKDGYQSFSPEKAFDEGYTRI